MDSFYMNQSTQNSHQQHRSRPNSRLSSTAEQLSSLNITASEQIGSIPNSPNFQNQSYLESQISPQQQDFIPAPIPQQSLPFPLLSEEDLDPNWSYLTTSEEHLGSAPLLRLDPPESTFPGQQQHQSYSDGRSIRSSSNPSTMSALGIQQYDGRFDASLYGGVRHTFTWPGPLDIQAQQYIQQNPNQGQMASSLYNEPQMIPMYARSTSSSPPRANLTPEQRELKRQRDYARRDSKTKARRERSSSNRSSHYVTSQNASPDLLPRTLPEYTNTLVPSPLLSLNSLQSSPALRSNSFLSPISPYVPQMGEHSSPELFGSMYTMDPEFSTPAYIPFPNASESNFLPFANRPHSLSLSSTPDHTNIYRNQELSPKMLSSETPEQVRLVNSRPKPQCWEHGCNGRQFSTFSNLLRHQREKSGAAQKSSCPHCGAEFTRTTARNGHMAHDKCKARMDS